MHCKIVDLNPLHNLMMRATEDQRILVASFITHFEIFVVWLSVCLNIDLKEKFDSGKNALARTRQLNENCIVFVHKSPGHAAISEVERLAGTWYGSIFFLGASISSLSRKRYHS